MPNVQHSTKKVYLIRCGHCMIELFSTNSFGFVYDQILFYMKKRHTNIQFISILLLVIKCYSPRRAVAQQINFELLRTKMLLFYFILGVMLGYIFSLNEVSAIFIRKLDLNLNKTVYQYTIGLLVYSILGLYVTARVNPLNVLFNVKQVYQRSTYIFYWLIRLS